VLKDIDTQQYAVTMVSPRNHFLFTPLLPSTTVGTIEFRSIIEPIRTARKNVRFYLAQCVGLDIAKSKAYCRGSFGNTPFEIDYDICVIGVGAVSNTFRIPGVEENCLFLKELNDARAIREKIIENFERACKPGRPVEEVKNLLHFVVVGGGPTGVEFAAEAHDFITEDLSKWFPDLMEHVRLSLLEAQEGILTQFDAKLSNYALKIFRRQRINVRTNSLVKEVTDEAVILKDGEEIPYGLVVWSTGIGPTPLVRSLDVPKDRLSRLVTDDTFLVKGTTNIYAIGDCAVIEGNDLPPTAQVAQQEGTYLARMLNKVIRNSDVKPFHYKHKGMMAYVGSKQALADLKNVKGRGFTTWLFWRSAYLTKLVSFKNKLLVVEDWMRTWIFGRDISRF
jgi:NADH dehydrogenase FAD-containing subunit